MRKKSLILLGILIISMISFGCSNSNQSSDNEVISNQNNSSQQSLQNNQENSAGNNSQDNNNSQSNPQQSQITDNDNSQNKTGQYVICIDPGHQAKGDMSQEPVGPGSSETKFKVSWGTQGVSTNIPEYELTLSASKILKSYLEQMGFKVIMTRETNDVNITNSERATFANENNADLVIRIHADGSDNTGITGASILIPSKDGQYTSAIFEDSSNCAKYVNENMQNNGFKVNGIFERSDLTGFNWSQVPVVLLEMGFMSNYTEDQNMSSPQYQEKMMTCVADGLDNYFKNKK